MTREIAVMVTDPVGSGKDPGVARGAARLELVDSSPFLAGWEALTYCENFSCV